MTTDDGRHTDEDNKPPRFSSRPEARWAMWAGIAGGVIATLLSVKGILGSASSTAAIGFVFVPFIAIVAMLPSALWGLAAGCVWLSLRGARQYAPAMLVAAWVLALAGPAVVGWEIWHGLSLERAVKEVRSMDGRALEADFQRSPWSHDKFYLGALVGRNDASPELLDRIAALDDPALYESMGSLWDVMGDNRKGIAVMRLVANHPNARGEMLARLADGPHADALRHELARNSNTPTRILARWYESDDYLVEWGLALNPNTPPTVMERLSKSANRYTRLNLTYNKATPAVILERFLEDPDEILARNARQALERRNRQ